MRVLVACEESQVVCKAFRARGHEAFSCDIQECSGGHPEWHIQDDVTFHLNEGWDLMVAHPPCTYFCRPGLHWESRKPERSQMRIESLKLVNALWNAPIKKIALENPIGWLNTNWRKPTQIIHPWYFGDGEMKETCLWLKNLTRINGLVQIALNPNEHKPKPLRSQVGADGKMKNKYFVTRVRSAKDRSKTFPGIANAMAEQWG